MSVGSVKNKLIKGIAAFIFCLPAVIPANLLRSIIPQSMFTQPTFLLVCIVSFISALRLAGLVLIAALFIKNDVLKESIKCMLLFVAIKLIGLFTADGTILFDVLNPLLYEILDTFETYNYRQSIVSGNISLGGTIHLVKVILQLIPAVGACAILCVIFNKKQNNIIDKKSFAPCIVAAIVPVFVLAVVLINTKFSFPRADMLVIRSYINGFIIAFSSALLAAIVSMLLALLVQNSGVAGIICVTVLHLTCNNLIGEYMLVRSVGLINSALGMVFMNMSMIPVTSIIFAYITRKSNNIINYVIALFTVFVILFGWFWGDYMSALITVRDRSLFPISLLLREAMIGTEEGAEIAGAFLYTMIPVIISAVGITLASLLTGKEE